MTPEQTAAAIRPHLQEILADLPGQYLTPGRLRSVVPGLEQCATKVLREVLRALSGELRSILVYVDTDYWDPLDAPAPPYEPPNPPTGRPPEPPAQLARRLAECLPVSGLPPAQLARAARVSPRRARSALRTMHDLQLAWVCATPDRRTRTGIACRVYPRSVTPPDPYWAVRSGADPEELAAAMASLDRTLVAETADEVAALPRCPATPEALSEALGIAPGLAEAVLRMLRVGRS